MEHFNDSMYKLELGRTQVKIWLELVYLAKNQKCSLSTIVPVIDKTLVMFFKVIRGNLVFLYPSCLNGLESIARSNRNRYKLMLVFVHGFL